nr:MAG TPA: protein of unknown function (DUF1793) [Caudoviricetes sp.]
MKYNLLWCFLLGLGIDNAGEMAKFAKKGGVL